jgi:Zn-dependent M16 (insulinase) family peptidase
MQRTAYPASSAYQSETGGLMEALRVLDVETIKNYHQSYYVPHNLCLIVAGRLSTNDLLNVLQGQVEPRILEHGQAHGPRPDGWKRPFLETSSVKPPVLSTVKKETVEFPEKDESMGEVSLLFLGPSNSDRLTLKVSHTISLHTSSLT